MERHPLVDFFAMRNGFLDNDLYPSGIPSGNPLSIVPKTNPSQLVSIDHMLSSSSDISEPFKLLGVNMAYAPDAQSDPPAGIRSPQDFMAFASAFQCFSWVTDKSHLPSLSDLIHLCAILTKSLQSHPASFINYAISIVIHEARLIQDVYSDNTALLCIFSLIEAAKTMPAKYAYIILDFYAAAFRHKTEANVSISTSSFVRLIKGKSSSIGFPRSTPIEEAVIDGFGEFDKFSWTVFSLLTNWDPRSKALQRFQRLPEKFDSICDSEPLVEKMNQIPINPPTFSQFFEVSLTGLVEEPLYVSDFCSEQVMQILNSVADALADASDYAQAAFFDPFIAKLLKLNDKRRLFIQTAFLIIILRKLENAFQLKKSADVLLKFSPDIHIFSPSGVGEWTRVQRKDVFLLIVDIYPMLIPQILSQQSEYPFVFTETLLRILTASSPSVIKLVSSSNILPLYAKNTMFLAKEFESNNSKYVTAAFESDISFNLFLLADQISVHSCLANEAYFNPLMKALSTSQLEPLFCQAVRSVLSICDDNGNSDKPLISFLFSFFTVKPSSSLADILTESLEMRPNSIEEFSIIFDRFLEIGSQVPFEGGMKFCLKYIALSKAYTFKLDTSNFGKFINCIYYVEKDDPSIATETILFDALTCGSLKDAKVYIRQPCILPIILSAFSRSKNFETILLRIQKICSYSNVNYRRCHDGYLDFLILSYFLNRPKSVFLFGFPIALQDQSQIYLSMLSKISAAASDSSIAKLYTKIVTKFRKSDFLESICLTLRLCANRKAPVFQLGFFPPQLSLPPIEWEILRRGFFISMNLSFDFEALLSSGCSLQIFSIENTLCGSFFFRFYRGSIFLQLVSGAESSTVQISSINTSKNSTILTTKFIPLQTGIKIQCKIDRELMAPIEFQCESPFPSKYVNFSVGGCSNSRPTFLASSPMGSANEITITLANQIVFFNSANYNKPCFVPSDNLSHYLPRGSFASHICRTLLMGVDELYVKSAFEAISIVFKLSEDAQKMFNDTPTLVKFFINSDRSLQLFINFSNILLSVSHNPLIHNLLTNIVINPFIWVKSSDFEGILMYWNTAIIGRYFSQFSEFGWEHWKSFLPIFFPEDVSLPKKYVTSEACFSQFIQFLTSVLRIRSEASDLQFLFDLLGSAHSQLLTQTTVGLIWEILFAHPDLANVPGRELGLIHSMILNDDTTICVQSTLILQEIAAENLDPHFVIASSAMSRKEKAIYGLIHHIEEFPNLIPLFCMIAVQSGKEEQAVIISAMQAIQKINQFTYSRIWFIWPLILALFAEEINVDPFCEFFVRLFNGSPTWESDLQLIASLIELISSDTDTNVDVFIKSFSKYLVKASFSRNLSPSAIFNFLFQNIFFHFTHQNLGRKLLQVLTESPFSDSLEPPKAKFSKSIRNFDSLQSFLKNDPKYATFSFQIRMNSLEEWIDSDQAEEAIQVFKMIEKPDKMASMKYSILAQFQSSLKQPRQKALPIPPQLDSQIISCIQELNGTISTLSTLREDISICLSISSKGFPIENADPINLSFNDKEPEFSAARGRDPSLCLHFCPMKLLPKRSVPIPSPQPIQGRPVLSKSCMVYRFGSDIVSGRFENFSGGFISITYEGALETIPINSIERVFERKIPEFSIEILTSDRLDILVAFKAADIAEVFEIFRGLPSSETKFITQSKSSSAFKALNVQEEWEAHRVSLFSYLMKLNFYSGRSFQEKNTYPIFPNVLRFLDSPEGFRIPHPSDSLNPEVFFFPEGVNVQLPKWAKSNYEYSYLSRKHLESSTVASQIEGWINTAFGFQFAPKTTVHTHCLSIIEPPLLKSKANACACLTKKDISDLIFLQSDGSLVFLELKLGKIEQKKQLPNVKASSALNNGCSFVFVTSDSLLRASYSNVYDPIQFQVSGKSVVSFNGEEIMFSNDRSDLMAVKFSSAQFAPRLIFTFSSEIRSIVSDADFKIIAVETLDQRIHIISSNSCGRVGKYYLGSDVLHMAITKCLGFVVIHSENEMTVLDVNGGLIKRVSFQHEFEQWFMFSSSSELDYVAYQTAEGSIKFFEAFFPECPHQTLVQKAKRLLFIGYNPSQQCFMMVFDDTSISIVPYSFYV